jgi:hypothetical protein
MVTFEHTDGRMVALGCKITIGCVSTPGTAVGGVDSTAIPTVGDDVKRFVGGLEAPVQGSLIAKEKGMNQFHRINTVAVRDNEGKHGALMGVQVEANPK